MRQWSNQHWFRYWLVAWSAPSHYQNQCWNIVNETLRNKLQWIFSHNSNIFIQENAFESVVCEKAAFLSRPQCVKPILRKPWYDMSFVKSEINTFFWGFYSLTHWGRDKMDAVSQTTGSNAFSWMKMYWFWLKFHWTLFPRVQLTIFQHWFR